MEIQTQFWLKEIEWNNKADMYKLGSRDPQEQKTS